MAPIGTLYTDVNNKRARLPLVVAAYAGLELTVPELTFGVTNKEAGYLAKFPQGKVPSFESTDGVNIFEVSAINRYLAALAPNSGLLGKDLKEAALIDQFIHLAEEEVGENARITLKLTLGKITPYNKPLQTAVHEAELRALATLEKHISTRTFFVGDRITLADITVASNVIRSFSLSVPPNERQQFPNLLRHMETIANNKKMSKILLPIVLATAAPQPPKVQK